MYYNRRYVNFLQETNKKQAPDFSEACFFDMQLLAGLLGSLSLSLLFLSLLGSSLSSLCSGLIGGDSPLSQLNADLVSTGLNDDLLSFLIISSGIRLPPILCGEFAIISIP